MEYFCDTGIPVGDLSAAHAVKSLPELEQLYAAYLSLAASAANEIIFSQVSPTALPIFDFVKKLLKPVITQKITWSELTEGSEIDPLDLKYIEEYLGNFCYQFGDYLGFGDKKFIPRCSREVFSKLIHSISAKRDNKNIPVYNDNAQLERTFKQVIELIYHVDKKNDIIGWLPDHVTTYYSHNMKRSEVEAIDGLLKTIKDPYDEEKRLIMIENTGILREDDTKQYVVTIPSIERDEQDAILLRDSEISSDSLKKGYKLVMRRGFHANELRKVCGWLTKAKEVVSLMKNSDKSRGDKERDLELENRKCMLDDLINHFKYGSYRKYWDYSAKWVKDMKPLVETYQGYVETYRDPSGCRAEYEAFVACVDAEETKCLKALIGKAPEVLAMMPYSKSFEKKTFIPPTYNAINIITFSSTGLPIGINIPNMDDIRQHIGFKNVSLINVLRARQNIQTSHEEKAKIYYSIPDDGRLDKYLKHSVKVLDIQVALHELYGHGSGRLVDVADRDALIKNFQKENNEKMAERIRNAPLYPEPNGFQSRFGGLSSAYEECRAEASALYLGICERSKETLLKDVFGIKEEDINDVQYAMIYEMLNLGIVAIPSYNVDTESWMQAHSAARFCILNFIYTDVANKDFFNITCDSEKNVIKLDIKDTPEAFEAIKNASERLLRILNEFKALGDAENGLAWFKKMTTVDGMWKDAVKVTKELRRPRMICIGSVITEKDNTYKIENGSSLYGPGPISVALTLCHNSEQASLIKE